jgi:hypothetical protein
VRKQIYYCDRCGKQYKPGVKKTGQPKYIELLRLLMLLGFGAYTSAPKQHFCSSCVMSFKEWYNFKPIRQRIKYRK